MNPSRNEPWPRRWARSVFALDVRSLAVYRMALGALLCIDCLLRLRDFPLMFAVDGIFPPEAIRRLAGDPTVWSLAFLHDATWWSGAVLALQGVAGIILAIGWRTRTATIVAWVALVSVVRRTAPAANAGDTWLACQLFWSMFLPLGAVWSCDARRREAASGSVCSVATAALVLQLVFVYVSAGLSKCNATWTEGDALAQALSVYDHGTWLGTVVAHTGLLGRPAAWAIVMLEAVLPVLLVVWPTTAVRLAVTAAFVVFHAGVWLLMSVGLFVPISLAAWLPLLPAAVWRRAPPAPGCGTVPSLPRPAAWACGAALALACVSVLNSRWWSVQLPRPLAIAINLTMLDQEWGMFGRVQPVEQWVYARAELADGQIVDLMRGGRPCAGERPVGGFTSLPHHRWHKLCWVIGSRSMRGLAPEVAAGLARHWNASHPPEQHVRSVELRHAMLDTDVPDGAEYEYIVAAWPGRSPEGGGNLERFLQATDSVQSGASAVIP